MYQLPIKNIHLNASAANKQQAIEQIASALAQSGYVTSEYLNGMLQREQQTSTYLGNGIAIPHGTTDTRHLVLNTGVQVFQFPQGIEWGEGQTAYIVIGIAACSDEHLSLLRQLAHVLSDESLAHQLANTNSAEQLRSLLMGEKQSAEFRFDASMIVLDIDVDNIVTLQALNAGRLQQINAVDHHFIADVLSHPPVSLGQGIWLCDSLKGNLLSAATVSRPTRMFNLNGEPVGLLLTISVADRQPNPLLNRLGSLLIAQQAERLLTADIATLLALLTSDTMPDEQALSAEFVIHNEHGLHARPSTVLLNTIKQFNTEVTVANLNGSGKPVNGRSMMKLVSLGVQKGHRLRFTATGKDAQNALSAIGNAISAGLGEGV